MRRRLLGLGVAPFAGPPLFLGALVLADTLAGEGLFLYQLRYEQRLLATQALSDAVAALAGSYVIAMLLIGVGLVARRAAGAAHAWRWMSVAGAVTGLGLGTFLAGTPADPGVWGLALAGAVFGAVMAVPLGRVLEMRAPSPAAR